MLTYRRILAIVVLSVLPLVAVAHAAEAPADRSVLRVYFDDARQLARLGAELDVWSVDRAGGFAIVSLKAPEIADLEAEGFRMEPAPESISLAGAPLDSRFYYYDDFEPNGRDRYLTAIYDIVDNVAPELSEVIDIGPAWESTDGGYDRRLFVVRVTNEDPAFGPIDEKPPFFLFANMHAREVATPEVAVRYVKYLLVGHRGQGGYGVDADSTWLVDHHVAYVLVMTNPDGHVVNEADTGAFRRKNTNDTNGCGFGPDVGVDLNRNHSFLWGCCGGSSGQACSSTYRGPSPASEPETQAFQNYFASVMDDQNGPNGDNEIPPAAPDDTEGLFISLHSYGDIILWPWNFPGFGDAPNADGLETIGRKLAHFNGYSATNGDIGYPVDGASDDWVYGKFGIAAFTFEVGASFGSCGGFFPDFGCIDGTASRDFWRENGRAFQYAHKVAGEPYLISRGPDALGVSVSGLDLTATFEDRRISGEPERDILDAEFFVDTPGAAGTGTPLNPSDGAWGERVEAGEAVIDTSGLASGLHYVMVRGRTSEGWGPFTAAWFDVP